ncbi:Uma2 family endonuclease [Dactylosporangium sp. NPDC005555]|uniref:Uma2 family endonuclease n=1 Tax=Dactylosporangium sp. NPDC005555 TaxID=3154889 RepID=UPI0033B882C3
MDTVPDWMIPPRIEGWYADDLDHLPDVPQHVELIDGILVLSGWPRQQWHSRLVSTLARALGKQAPADIHIEAQMTIRLDERSRLEPDLLATTAAYNPDRTFFTPDEALLVVEVESPESAHCDRTVKLHKYAEASIAHYWRIEEEDSSPVVYAYELDESTRAYVAIGIHRGTLRLAVPFEMTIDLDKLLPARR